jgi:hypothetical protein
MAGFGGKRMKDKRLNRSVFNEYKIKLGQIERNGLHLLAAQLDLTFNQVVTLALNDFLRRKLRTGVFNALDDDRYINRLIGETVNANRGIWGYDPEINDIPGDKKWLLLKRNNR